MRHGLGSRNTRKSGAAVIALALVAVMLFAACGSSSSGGSNNNASGATGAAAGSGFDGIGGNGAIPGLYTETTQPTPGGSMTFALEAESTGGWCLPEA